jgi:undecaprenyl-diphosphatase
LDTLNQIDTQLFLFFNGLHNETFDHIMVWVSGKTTWWPFYLALLAYLVWSRRLQVIPVLLFIALCVTLADQSSVKLFKDVFERLRPCREPALEGLVHMVNGKCGGLYGFVSSHAANTFGVAMLLLLIVKKQWFSVLMLVWATLVSYSRIYLGVHYPGDIIGGAVLGMLCGYLVYLLFRWAIPRLPASWNMNDRPYIAGK